jgi:hypothetical protein
VSPLLLLSCFAILLLHPVEILFSRFVINTMGQTTRITGTGIHYAVFLFL